MTPTRGTDMPSREGLPLWRVPVTYGAIGATRDAELLKHPPRGYRPIERRVRIGHGAERWAYAWVQVLSWGIQRAAGFHVETVDAPGHINELTYTPVTFDDDGNPVIPAVTGHGDETIYAPDGSPLLRPGDSALLKWWAWPLKIPVRVVYVIDEPQRRGFAYGTLPGHPEEGEEAFIVERRDDDSVWLIIRAFSRPSNRWYWVGYPALRLLQALFTHRYEHALTGRIEEPAA